MNRKNSPAIALFGIMLAVSFLVNARAADSPNLSQPSRRGTSKGSANGVSKNEMDQLVDFLLKNGTDNHIGEKFTNIMGGSPSLVKQGLIMKERHGKDISQLVCQLAYVESSTAEATDGKRPLCIYLTNVKGSGHDEERQLFRVDLDGHLEKAVIARAKRDDDGRDIPGSATPLDQDIDSSETKKAFAAQMVQVRAWLKKQKLSAKAAAPADDVAAPIQTAP